MKMAGFTISGFMVVRKPECQQAAFHNVRWRLGDKIYRGIDRLPWEDLDDAYYQGVLDGALLALRKRLEAENRDLTGIKTIKDYEAAREVWQAYQDKSEILAVWSPELAEVKGSFVYEGHLDYLGIDCTSPGEWSVLLSGVFAHPELFPLEADRLNAFGLLESEADCDAAFGHYMELASRGRVEPVRSDARPCRIRVFSAPAWSEGRP
jgi:hypothetical protein